MTKLRGFFFAFLYSLSTIAAFGDVPELIDAARAGDLEKVKALIAAGADVNVIATDGIYDIVGGTALHAAARHGHPSIVRVLLEAGADPNRGLTEDGSPLFLAAWEGNMESVFLLLEAGADVNAKGKLHAGGGYPAMETDVLGAVDVYRRPEIVRLLVSQHVLTAAVNDSDIRVRDRPATEGSNTIGMLQKGDEVIVLGRSASKVPIGDMNDYWLKIHDPFWGPVFSYGAFFEISALNKDDVPVFQETSTGPPWRVGKTFRADYETVYFSNYGEDQRSSWTEELRIISERDAQFFKGASVKEEGTWIRLGDWIMLRLRGFDYFEDAAIPIEYTLFLEWRSDLGGFLKAEDAAKIEQEGFTLNRECKWFEHEDAQKRECVGYFTPVESR